jgi:glycosyltransferase involved in cell wall biosynthesis
MTQVSILTITQHSRFLSLKLLYHIIQRQQYVQIKEWVIVEGSQEEVLRDKNIININEFIDEKMEQTDIEMRYIVPDYIVPLSNLRNIGNDHCKGEIIVCMDDDDYYPPSRVPHAVEMLTKYNRSIAGCSGLYMYNYTKEKLYRAHGFHNNHSTNNCFAYKKSYLENHRYTEGLYYAEESSFTNDFREPMIQLHPEKCIVQTIHKENTVDKTDFLSNNNISEISEKDLTIFDLIPSDIYCKMKELYS